MPVHLPKSTFLMKMVSGMEVAEKRIILKTAGLGIFLIF
jgi:hypothetical protein